jgi:hypothetical protein
MPLNRASKNLTSNLNADLVTIPQFFQANAVTVLFETSHDHFTSDDPKVFFSFKVQ